jgi:pyruvate,water dikinase
VLSFVRAYLDVGEAQSPYRQQQRLVRERDELTRQVQDRVSKDWVGRVILGPVLRWVLKNTQVHTRERDTMHFEITRIFSPFRRLLLEFGRRWTARGLIEQPSDVFFLTLEEVTQVAGSPQPMQATVRERRAAFARSKKHGPPSILREGVQVSAGSQSAVTSRQGQLLGIAGSPGRVSGTARVIRGPEEFDKLQSGDILVAPLTNPVWTRLFAIAGGLITEVGGILSHGAIAAREYGIPAVMAVQDATKIVSDGHYLTVDGSKGLVLAQGAGAA